MPEDSVLLSDVVAHHRRLQARMREEFDALLFLAIDLFEERDRLATALRRDLPRDFDRLEHFLWHRMREAVDGYDLVAMDDVLEQPSPPGGVRLIRGWRIFPPR